MSQDENHFITTNQLHYKNLQSRQQKACRKNENISSSFQISDQLKSKFGGKQEIVSRSKSPSQVSNRK